MHTAFESLMDHSRWRELLQPGGGRVRISSALCSLAAVLAGRRPRLPLALECAFEEAVVVNKFVKGRSANRLSSPPLTCTMRKAVLRRHVLSDNGEVGGTPVHGDSAVEDADVAVVPAPIASKADLRGCAGR